MRRDIEENEHWFKICQEEIDAEAVKQANRPAKQEEAVPDLDEDTKASLAATIATAKMPEKLRPSADMWAQKRDAIVSPPVSPAQQKQSKRQSGNTTEAQPTEAEPGTKPATDGQEKRQKSAKHWANFDKKSLSEDKDGKK